MSTEPESTEKSSEEEKTIRLWTHTHTLPDGRKVKGGYHSDTGSFYWMFVSVDGTETRFALSGEAQHEMWCIYAKLLREKVQSGKKEG